MELLKLSNLVIAIFVLLCLITYTMQKSRKIVKTKKPDVKKLSSIIEPKIPDLTEDIFIPIKADSEVSDDNLYASDQLEGIYDAPMYVPADDTNIFLLNQINQKFNDAVAYVEPNLSGI